MDVQYVQHWGDDLLVCNAARVSFDKKSDWEYAHVPIMSSIEHGSVGYVEKRLSAKDEKLIHYLAKHKHTSCFEHMGATLKLKVPIFIARQIQRHRTFCLAGDNEISFSRPSDGTHYPYRLDRLYKNWSDPAQRVRLEKMLIRSVDEDNKTIFNNRLVDVVYSGKKPVYTVLLDNGAEVTGSEDHRILTAEGWLTIRDLMEAPVPVLAANAHLVRNVESAWPAQIVSSEWRWIPGWENRYEVSDAGEVRSWVNTRGVPLKVPHTKRRTKNTAGYACVSLSRDGLSRMYNCHSLVMEAFVGPRPAGQEVRHLDGNRLNSHKSNLVYGFPYENQEDRKDHGTVKHLGADYYDVLEIVFRGVEDTYDIAVDGPHHNFFAGGVVVHNSYNEISRRYVDSPPEFFWPSKWRKRADNVKQGSAEDEVPCMIRVDGTPFVELTPQMYAESLVDSCVTTYNGLLASGVAPEQARMILPQNLYTEMYMSGNLRAWTHFLHLRLDGHAQAEVREVAKMVEEILAPLFPVSMKALMDNP